MEIGILLFTLGAYGLAGFLAWRDRQAHYLVGLVAGHLATLPSPIWQALYGFGYDPSLAPLYTLLDRPLPRAIFLAGWTIMLPPLVIFYLQGRRWWVSGYLTGALTFALFVLYYALIELVGSRAGWWSTTAALPLGVSTTLLTAVMSALVSLGALAALLITRHYATLSLLPVLLPVPLLMSLVVNGLLGAPLYTVLLLGAQSWAAGLGLLGTLGLLLWGAHIITSELARQRIVGRPGW